MEMLSKEYGWTPREIREQRMDDINGYIKVINSKRRIEKYNNLKNGNK